MNLDALENLAREAAVLDHNETDRWYTPDELLSPYVTASEAVWYPKNARLMAAASPDQVLALIAAVKAAQTQLDAYDAIMASRGGEWPGDAVKAHEQSEAALRAALEQLKETK